MMMLRDSWSDIGGGEERAEPGIPPVVIDDSPAGLIDILESLARDETRERIAVGDLLEAMGDRAFGALMLIFALPNIVPTPPGTSAITGAPLVFLSAQLLMGKQPWLPRIIADRSIARKDFGAVVAKITPILARVQKLLKPRAEFLFHSTAERLTGLICLILAVILALPIPLGNMLPAVAICCFSFALLERDGVFSAIGALLSVVSVVLVSGVIYGIIKAALYFLATPFWQ